MNKPVVYKHASLRFFEKNEFHVNRTCNDDVLLLVYEGTLRFMEDGREFEVTAGHYHIQRYGSEQRGHAASDSPKYLYVHFRGIWGDNGDTLNYCGEFDYPALKKLIERADRLAYGKYTQTERSAVFFEILSVLYRSQFPQTKENVIAEYIQKHFEENITLEKISKEFNYSKNHIINIFKREFSQTPIEYLNEVRIQKAMHLLEVTSDTTESIAQTCGFQNYSHFYRLFMRQNHISPAAWRKKRRITAV